MCENDNTNQSSDISDETKKRPYYYDDSFGYEVYTEDEEEEPENEENR
jgi:hypothetical protein